MDRSTGLTRQEKAISLFEFVRELNKLKQKLVLDMHEYPLCRPLSALPDDPEHIRVFFRDRVEEETAAAPKLVYISNPTEWGTLYTKAELEALSISKEQKSVLAQFMATLMERDV